jgi:hypothetical protein
MLTLEQQNFYQTFGFLVFRQAFSPDEMAEISRVADEVLEQARNGKPWDGLVREEVLGFVEHRPELARLVEDDRIYGVAEDLLGPGFVWITSDGNLYVGDTQWHPDANWPDLTFHSIKFALYLDPVRKNSGCLRVIPGSHREPFYSELKVLSKHRGTPPEYPFGVTGEQIPAFPLESDPGDLVLFNHRLHHASFGGNDHRRMFTLNFTQRPTTDEHVGYHRKLYEGHVKRQAAFRFGAKDRVYVPEFLAGGGPRRQSVVKPIIEWGFR